MNSEMHEGKHLFGRVRREGPIKNSLHLTLGCRIQFLENVAAVLLQHSEVKLLMKVQLWV